MARVAARGSDKRVLKLIRAFLKAGVMEDGLVSPVDEGTPQGGPLSPLLSNLVLDDLDKELTRRTRGNSLPQVIVDLAPYLLGWRGYFGFCQTPRVLTHLEAWIRRRLRSYLWRQWQNGRNRFKELRRRGVPKFHAAVAAGSPTGFWRMSGHPAVQQALRNPYFDGLGLPRLYVPAHAQPDRTTVVRTRMPGGVAGVAPRGVPLSRSSAHPSRSRSLRRRSANRTNSGRSA